MNKNKKYVHKFVPGKYIVEYDDGRLLGPFFIDSIDHLPMDDDNTDPVTLYAIGLTLSVEVTTIISLKEV